MDLEGMMLSEEVRESQIVYELTYVWNIKNKQQTQTHRKGDQVCGYQRGRGCVLAGWCRGWEGGLEEGGQKVQTSSHKINMSWGCNVQRDDSS